MIKKILIITNMLAIALLVTGCPGSMQKKLEGEYHKEQSKQRSDKSFEELQRDLNK